MFKSGQEIGQLTSPTGTNFTVQATQNHLNLNSGFSGTAITAMRIYGGSGTTAGYVGIGDYTNFTAGSLLHLHQNAANFPVDFKMTNAGIGSGALDGFKIEALANGVANIRQYEENFLDFYTENQNILTTDLRMRMSTALLGSRTVTRVGISENGLGWSGIGFERPVSLLHLGSAWQPQTGGHRNWMDVGTFTNAQTDYIYVGLKNERNFPTDLWTDFMDAVVAWGDNRNIADSFNDLRFIFTTPTQAPGIPGLQDGQEMMRISFNGNVGVGNFYTPGIPNSTAIRPARRLEVLDGGLNAPQLRLTFSQPSGPIPGMRTEFQTTDAGNLFINPIAGVTYMNVGINTILPGATLEINSNATSITPGQSGLRFTDLTSASTPATSNGRVLTVNATGDVKLTNDVGVGVCTPIIPVDFITKFSSNTPVAICNSNIWESPSVDQRVGIGTTTFPATSKVGISAYVPSSASSAEAMNIESIQSNNVNYNKGINMILQGGILGNNGIDINLSNSTGSSNGIRVQNNCAGSAGSDAFGFQANVSGGSNSANYGLLVLAREGVNSNYGVFSAVNSTTNIANTNVGIYSSVISGLNSYGVQSVAFSGINQTIGVEGSAQSSGTNFGVRGLATSAATINYGIYGEVTSSSCANGPTCTKAAGYFNGAVYSTIGYYTSDRNLKKKIRPLINASAILNALYPSTFEFDSLFIPQMTLPEGNHYGLIAQDVEQVLPDIVENFIQPTVYDSLGKVIHPQGEFKALNYTELIPFLIQGFKEQQSQIDSLKAVIAALPVIPAIAPANDQRQLNRIELKDSKGIILNQNDPNPFSESTLITYSIPDEIKSSKLIFSDNKGQVLREVIINERGSGSLEVYASELSTGIYHYTLIADGKVIESKKMMKTK